MDALKFMKEKKRMCASYNFCYQCPIDAVNHYTCNSVILKEETELQKIIEIVKQWSKDHPEIVGDKYIVEIDCVADGGERLHIKDLDIWVKKRNLSKLKKYTLG